MNDLVKINPDQSDHPIDGFPPEIIAVDDFSVNPSDTGPVSITINTDSRENTYQQRFLPPDVEAFERTLVDQIEKVEAYKREMDGKLFGYLGWDAFTVLIPGLNALINLWAGLMLLGAAGRVRAPFGTRLNIILLTGIDMIIGMFPIAGDAVDILFRSTAWNADRVASFASDKLVYLDKARQHAAQQGGYTDRDIEAIRDHLFRNGSNIWMTRLPLLIAGGLFVLWTASGIVG